MFRAPSPEMVSESTLTGVDGADGGGVLGAGVGGVACATGVDGRGGALTATPPLPGLAKSELAIGTFASIFENVTFCLFGLPFVPFSTEKGRYQPLTSL